LTRRELRAELRAGRAIPVWLRFYGWDFCRCNGIIEGYTIPLRRRLPIPLSRDNAIFQARCNDCGTSAEGVMEDFADRPLIEVGARPRSERDG
jgi:hypothetical protein